jgi:hypothetical protein
MAQSAAVCLRPLLRKQNLSNAAGDSSPPATHTPNQHSHERPEGARGGAVAPRRRRVGAGPQGGGRVDGGDAAEAHQVDGRKDEDGAEPVGSCIFWRRSFFRTLAAEAAAQAAGSSMKKRTAETQPKYIIQKATHRPRWASARYPPRSGVMKTVPLNICSSWLALAAE